MPVNSKVVLTVQGIDNEVFWKVIYFLRAVYPALKALHYCNSNIKAMDKIFHFFKRAEGAILKSVEDLDDDTIFGTYYFSWL